MLHVSNDDVCCTSQIARLRDDVRGSKSKPRYLRCTTPHVNCGKPPADISPCTYVLRPYTNYTLERVSKVANALQNCKVIFGLHCCDLKNSIVELPVPDPRCAHRITPVTWVCRAQ